MRKEIEERNARLAREMERDPERYIKVHEAIEILMNVSMLVDNAVQTIDEFAPFLLYGKMHGFKDLHKALDKCVKKARADMSDDSLYMSCVRDSFRLYDIFVAILRMSDTEQGWIQLDTVAKTYIEAPKYQNYYRERLLKHGIAYWNIHDVENLRIWEDKLKQAKGIEEKG